MAAGVVYMNPHKLNLNDVRGFGRKKPILHFAFLMGAVGLMGVPGFSGYVLQDADSRGHCGIRRAACGGGHGRAGAALPRRGNGFICSPAA